MNLMASIVQGAGCVDKNFILNLTRPAAWAFSARVGNLHLDLSSQQESLLPLSHCAENLIVQKPGCVVVDAQVTAQLQRGNTGFGLANEI